MAEYISLYYGICLYIGTADYCKIIWFFGIIIKMRVYFRTIERRSYQMKKVAIVMGSDSDLAVLQPAFDKLKELSIPFEARIISAHRTPAIAADFAKNAENNGFGVIIAAAGKAAHLAGAMAANTVLPIIGVPIKSSTLDGLDALLSTVQMPSGIPVATVAIDGSANAAILAAQIIALGNEELLMRIKALRASMEKAVIEKDRRLVGNYT